MRWSAVKILTNSLPASNHLELTREPCVVAFENGTEPSDNGQEKTVQRRDYRGLLRVDKSTRINGVPDALLIELADDAVTSEEPN